MGKIEEVQQYFKICIDNKDKTFTFVPKFFDEDKTIYTNEEKVISSMSDVEMLKKHHEENRKIVLNSYG